MENQKFKHEEALRTLKAEISKDGEQNGNGKRKAVQNNEKNVEIIVKRKKEDKKEKEQKILEGIERYILSKITETKYIFFFLFNIYLSVFFLLIDYLQYYNIYNYRF